MTSTAVHRAGMSLDTIVEALLQVFDRGISLAGPFLLLLGWGLVSCIGFLHFSTPLLPLTIDYVHVHVLGAWLWFNIMFNWVMCFKTYPGRPPRTVSNVSDSCQKCDGSKPARAHHCHVCNECVLAMDHHCPWMANCVGFYNYRYFVLTLIYLVWGCMFCVIVAAFGYEIPQKMWFRGTSIDSTPRASVFVFIVCSSAGGAVAMLMAWHLYLIITAQTTIEFYQRRMVPRSHRHRPSTWFSLCWPGQLPNNDYDLGFRGNWDRVFGASKIPLGWAAPSMRPPEGDGIAWKSCKSLVAGNLV